MKPKRVPLAAIHLDATDFSVVDHPPNLDRGDSSFKHDFLTLRSHSAVPKASSIDLVSMARPRGNATGFDAGKFAASASASANTPVRDPWARAEAWRYTGPFSRWNRFKGAFPGLGVATVAFTIYLGYEYIFLRDTHHGHAEASDNEGHH